MPSEDLCANLAVLWGRETLQETEPGKILGSFIIDNLSSLNAGSLTWVAHKRKPIDGRYMAFYVGISFNTTSDGKQWPVGEEGVMDFTTTVSVVPNTFPYPDCSGEECYGQLL